MLPDLLKLGRLPSPWLGIRYAYSVTPGLAEILKLPVSQGLLLNQMYDQRRWLRRKRTGRRAVSSATNVYIGGDILLAVDGVPVSRLEELEVLLEDNYRVGDVVTVKLLATVEEFEVQIELAEEAGTI